MQAELEVNDLKYNSFFLYWMEMAKVIGMQL